MILFRLEDTALRISPLHPNQFGFLKGKSTTTAISKLLTSLEQLKEQNTPATALFLDIREAFDNVPYDSLFAILENPQRNIDSCITKWLKHLYQTRISTTYGTFSNESITIGHTKGVPQGSVLSPQMWNYFYDDLIYTVSNLAHTVVAYADDLCVLLACEDTFLLHQTTQQILHVIEEWGQRNSITFCPQKTEVVFFNWTPDPSIYPPLTLSQSTLPVSNTFRYLGLVLTRDLSWKTNLESKIKSGKATMIRVCRTFGKFWGPIAKMIKWHLEQVIFPNVMYGSHAYHKLLTTPHFFTKLQQLSRIALLQTSPCRTHTPIAGMQIILGVMPLAIRARYNNLAAWLRLNNYQTTPPPGVILPPHLQAIYDDFVKTGLAHCDLDALPRTPNPHILNIEIGEGVELESHHRNDIGIYTDGAKFDEPEQWGTGAGYVIMSHQEVIINSHITLCQTKTVFQAEVIAIQHSLRTFLHFVSTGRIAHNASITLFTDSQSSLKALSSTYITSKTVRDCLELINTVSLDHHINFVWIRARQSMGRCHGKTRSPHPTTRGGPRSLPLCPPKLCKVPTPPGCP